MTTNVNYEKFILDKVRLDKRLGFDVQDSEIHPMLFPHQRAIVKWALEGGRRAIFAAFGLGKSFMQLECCRQVGNREGGRQLIVAPLGVRQEFKRDAEKLGLSIQFLRFNHELKGDGLYITNYESIRDGRLDPHNFNCISLDEAAVLRSYGSLTFQTFLTLFHGIKYRFVATATPSPNRFKELIHYAGFLGIMNTGDSLTRWFQRDSTKANQLTLYPHKKDEFWLWVASWAIFLQKPSDLGFSDEGYSLPKLHVHYHKVRACDAKGTNGRGQYKLINSAAMGLKDAAKEKRDSLPQRIDELKNILAEHPDDHASFGTIKKPNGMQSKKPCRLPRPFMVRWIWKPESSASWISATANINTSPQSRS